MKSSPLKTGIDIRRQLSNDSLQNALRLFLGWEDVTPLPVAEEAQEKGAWRSNVVISWSQADTVVREIERQKYSRLHRFAVLPSRNRPRWCLSRSSGSNVLNGFELYTPFSPSARLMKKFAIRMQAMGWQGWIRDSILIATRNPLPIENLVVEITAEQRPMFAFSLGVPGPFQKFTIQVMRQNGEILGYLKMPLGARADERVRHEAAVLQKLHTFPQLRAHIPRLLFAGPCNGTYVLFQSQLEGEAGPALFTPVHEEFLNTLQGCRPTVLPGQILIRHVGDKWERAARGLGTRWQNLSREALGLAARKLEASCITCGIHHGDFAPWNTRVHNGALFMLDWESAAWDAPVSWDLFHFLAQTECLLRKSHGSRNLWDVRTRDCPLYILYLLNSTAQLADEGANSVGIDYRESQLLYQMSQAVMPAGI
jgi:hypothetical protein